MPEETRLFPGTTPGKIITSPRLVGFEIECEHGITSVTASHLKKAHLLHVVDFKTDGTLDSSGLELCTLPASLEILEKHVYAATDACKKGGWETHSTKHCGLHTHIDFRDMRNNAQVIAQLFQFVYAIEPVIYEIISTTRRGNSYCVSIRQAFSFDYVAQCKTDEDVMLMWWRVNKEHAPRLKENCQEFSGHPPLSHYYGLNLSQIFEWGTVEFRYFQGTLDPEKMLHWAAFLQALVEYAIHDFDLMETSTLLAEKSPKKQMRMLLQLITLTPATRKWVKSFFTIKWKIQNALPGVAEKDNDDAQRDNDASNDSEDAWTDDEGADNPEYIISSGNVDAPF